MNQFFAERITLLRNERRLSQKQAAADLGISPAVLSHYEKGIRECKLELLVSIADYYEVSCDYLLGRTSSPTAQATQPAKRESSSDGSESHRRRCTGQKKMLVNTLHILFDILARCRNQELSIELSRSLTLMLYMIFHAVYCSNPENPLGVFRIPKQHAAARASAGITLSLSYARYALKKHSHMNSERIVLSPRLLYERYPAYAPSLFSLLEQAEDLCSTDREPGE